MPSEPVSEERTLVGWQDILFSLPPDWSLTAFSLDREDGYLKVDSPGTMFVQVKWAGPAMRRRPKSLAGAVLEMIRKARRVPAVDPGEPDLRERLETFLKDSEKQARKARVTFDSHMKSEETDASGARISRNFWWTGAGSAQGKIWYCRTCGRVVIAQVVGQKRDNIAAVASTLFGEITDHPADGWSVWALFDLVCAVPQAYQIKAHKLMSGYLRLDFAGAGGERVVVERWGLANIARRKFSLEDWYRNQTLALAHGAVGKPAEVDGHAAVRGSGSVRGPVARFGAIRDAALTMRPATVYDACVWECEDTNKLYAVQVWRSRKTDPLIDDVVARCECH